MPSTYTTNLGIELPNPGEQDGTWGTTLNNGYTVLDQATNGYVEVTLAGTGTTGSPNDLIPSELSGGSLQDGQNMLVKVADASDLGATSYLRLTPNTAERIMIIKNSLSGSRDLVVFQGTYGGGTAYTITNGTTAVLAFSGEGATQTIGTRNALDNLLISGALTASNLSGTNTGDEVAATETVAGKVELATQAEVDTGTDAERVITPATLAAWSKAPAITTKGDLLSWDTAAARLPVGADGYVLSADSAEATGLKWVAFSTGGLGNVVEDLTPQLGGLLDTNNFSISFTNTGSATGSRYYEPSAGGSSYVNVVAPALAATYTFTLPNSAGTNGYVLSTNGSGVTSWVAQSSGSVSSVTGSSPISSSGGTTPNISISTATTSLRGAIELATSTEVNAGTDTGKAVVPSTLASWGAQWTGSTSITTLGTISSGTWNGGTIPVAYGGTGATSKTGNGAVVLSISPSLVTPNINTATGTTLSLTGSCSAASYNTASARDKKTQVVGYINPDNLLNLNSILYTLNDDEEKRVHMGYFADEMDMQYPEIVEHDDDQKPIAINYSSLVVPLVEKIKQLEKRLRALEGRSWL